MIVLAPSSVQEMADHVFLGFDLADKYRNPVLMLSDGAIGQMMEKWNSNPIQNRIQINHGPLPVNRQPVNAITLHRFLSSPKEWKYIT